MRVNEGLIWGGSVGLSFLIHVMLLVDTGSKAGEAKPSATQTTRVSFRSVAAPPSPPQEAPVVEPLKPPEKEVVETPAPPPKPKPKKKAKVAEKVKQLEPVKPVEQPEATPPSPPTVSSAQKLAQQAEQAEGSVDDQALLEKAKNEYLRRLMTHIESHKKYPRAARRRAIEGEVSVRFQLQSDGVMTGVEVEEGHRVLRKAVEEALRHAQPLPKPPSELSFPLPVSFSVVFSLKDI